MTKKNASKTAAHALKEKVGGSYQAHLRELGGGGPGNPATPSEGAFIFGDRHPDGGSGSFVFEGDSKGSGTFLYDRTTGDSMDEDSTSPVGPEQTLTFEGVTFTYRMQSPTAAVGSYPDGPGLPTAFSMCLDTKHGKPNAIISCMVRQGSREARGLLALAFHIWPETSAARNKDPQGHPYRFVPRRYISIKKFAYIEVFDGDRLAGILRPPMAELIGERPDHWRLDCDGQDHGPGRTGRLLDTARAFVGTDKVTAFSPWSGWNDQGNTEPFPADVDWQE